MMDSHSVISDVTAGFVRELAAEYDVSLSRMYEKLGDQCVYPKAKELIRKIAKVNPKNIWQIKADLDAMFLDLIEDQGEVTIAELHKESSEAVQSALNDDPLDVQIRETRESIAAKSRHLAQLEKQKNGFSPKQAVADFRRKRAA